MENNCGIHAGKGREVIRHHEKSQTKHTWDFLVVCDTTMTFFFSCIREFLQAQQCESFKCKIILRKENEQQCSNRFFC